MTPEFTSVRSCCDTLERRRVSRRGGSAAAELRLHGERDRDPARLGQKDAPTLGRMAAMLARLHNRMDRQRFFASRGMEEGYASWLASELASRKAVVLAAIARSRGREQIVGYAYGRLEGRDWNTLRDAGGVGVDLYVVPRARRRGAGRLLLDALLRELVRRGAPHVVLHVAARNHRALAMFEAMGFRRTVVELAISPLRSAARWHRGALPDGGSDPLDGAERPDRRGRASTRMSAVGVSDSRSRRRVCLDPGPRRGYLQASGWLPSRSVKP